MTEWECFTCGADNEDTLCRDCGSPNYEALGQTAEEAALLSEHDEGKELHPYNGAVDTHWRCLTCGDTEEGLMHNDTWRNVEPLMEGY